MTSVEALLAEYVAQHRSGGEADPVEYLARASPSDRRELAALIDGYLSRVPRTPVAEGRVTDARTEATIEALSRSIGGAAGLWPALLPRLRGRAGLKRRELVERLARALDASEREQKVERYYHEMELGTLPASGVSDKVLEALAGLVGSTAAELREAGSLLGSDLAGDTGHAAVFARTASIESPGVAAPDIATSTDHAEWDEIDELFRGSE